MCLCGVIEFECAFGDMCVCVCVCVCVGREGCVCVREMGVWRERWVLFCVSACVWGELSLCGF